MNPYALIAADTAALDPRRSEDRFILEFAQAQAPKFEVDSQFVDGNPYEAVLPSFPDNLTVHRRVRARIEQLAREWYPR